MKYFTTFTYKTPKNQVGHGPPSSYSPVKGFYERQILFREDFSEK